MSRQSVYVSDHPHGKIPFLTSNQNFLCCNLSLSLLILILSLCTCEKSLTPSSLHPSVRSPKTAIVSSATPTWYRSNKSSSLSLSSHTVCSSPPSSTKHALVCQNLSCTGHHIARCACTDAETRGKNLFAQTAGYTQARKTSACSSPSLLQVHAADSGSTCCPLECQSLCLQSHLPPRVLSHWIAPSRTHNFTFALAELHVVSVSSFL